MGGLDDRSNEETKKRKLTVVKASLLKRKRHILNPTHSSRQFAEPNAYTGDSKEHPLFRRCVTAALMPGVPTSITDILVVTGQPLNVTSSCLMMLTTAGRVIAQRHRCGYQCFGGGKRRMPMLWSVHEARREASMERIANLCIKEDRTGRAGRVSRDSAGDQEEERQGA